jgi:hypothetical protein
MYFCHSPEIWRDFPELVPGVVMARGISIRDVASQTARFSAVAATRLERRSEGELPEIQAWRSRVFENGTETNTVSMRFGIAPAPL